MAKTNLCIVGLSKQFVDNLCKKLSSKLDMYYANIDEIFAYDLMDVGKIMEVCGIEYLEKEQKSIIKRVCSYENALINIDYSLLNRNEILDIVKNSCLVVYVYLNENNYILQQSKEMVSYNLLTINQDVFYDRDGILKNVGDIIVDCSDIQEDQLVEKIFKEIIKFYA